MDLKQTKKGLILVISGPSGAGKGTVRNELLKHSDFVFSVSATTRDPRPGEVRDVDYHYITREEFEGRIERGEMLEYTSYSGEYYGTVLAEATAVIESGRNLILEIEVEGAMNVKRNYPDAILIMLLSPSFAEQERRLRARATETEDKILKRLARTHEEMKYFPDYDYVVCNDVVEDCAEQIRAIVQVERYSTKRHPDVPVDYFKDSAGN